MNSSMKAEAPAPIRLVETDDDIRRCWPALRLLRPHLVEAEFVPLVRRMIAEGYQLAFVDVDGVAAAAVGFRYVQKLYDGRQFYIDDLTTLEAYRGRGYAGLLLDYVDERARTLGYACVTLDSGPHRHTAHRLYLNHGYVISSYHFTRRIE
jgi:GNAT superfamily N-acetyltransferase